MLAPDPRLEAIDRMDGLTFELAIKELLERLGCQDVELTPRYDEGADLLCTIEGVRTAVQVKRHSSGVRKSAVLQLYDGMQHYGCEAGILVTNSFLTPPAAERASFYGIEVWDRRQLAEWAAGDPQEIDVAHCAHCGAAVTAGVQKYCLDQPGRFGGLVYCYRHQARRFRQPS